ncbi:MAG: hypothetical protein ABIP77_05870, partial [Candidatus Limnocylindrales bacterium]
TPSPTATPTARPTTMDIALARTLAAGASVTVRGVVTAEAGRLGTPALIAIDDLSGAIVVRLPDGADRPTRGRTLEVRGILAEPYGQLELRPPGVDDVRDLGSGVLPTPTSLDAAGVIGGVIADLGETTEARLVTVSGIVASTPSKATSGDVTFDLERSGGTRIRIVADGSSGLGTTAVRLGATYRLTGVGGQRASRKGIADGYRIWLRDEADVVFVASPGATGPGATTTPGPTPSPTPRTTPRPTPSGRPTPAPSGGPVLVTVAQALAMADRDVVIQAIVTAGASLLDASGRRLVVQDATAAIEILVPAEVTVPSVGTRLRITGRVGIAYSAPRLRASAVERLGSGTTPAPLVVRGPLTDAHTWRLVTVTGRVDDMKKLGDRWRAELIVGAQRIVVVGQPGAGIPLTRLPEGASASITGIVRRAYANATDRRPSLLPRSGADIRITSSPRAGGPGVSDSGASSGGSRPSGGSGSAGGAGSAGPSHATDGTTGSANVGPVALSAVPNADLADLGALSGRTVRVGGLVTELTDAGFRLDDGTAIGLVVLLGDAAAFLPLIDPGDAVNVTGRVERQADASYAVTVTNAGAIALGIDLGTDLGQEVTSSPVPATATALRTPGPVRSAGSAGIGDGFGGLSVTGAGIVSTLLIALASLAVSLLRRRQTRRLMATRIAARLTDFAGPPPTRSVDPAPERGPSVGHAR